MDEGTVRQHAERHARTLRAGNLPSAFSDLTDQAKTQLEPYVLNFPSPVEEAQMVSLVPEPGGYSVLFQVSGGGRDLQIETTWAEVDGHPMIVKVRGIGERREP